MQKGFALPLVLAGVLLISLFAAGGYYFYNWQKINAVSSFEECSKLFPVMESYPAQCKTSDGRNFVQDLSEEEKKKLEPPTDFSISTKVNEVVSGKTYKSQEMGIEFILPGDFYFDSEAKLKFTDGDFNRITIKAPYRPKGQILDRSITITKPIFASFKNMKDCHDMISNSLCKENEKEILVDGLKGREFYVPSYSVRHIQFESVNIDIEIPSGTPKIDEDRIREFINSLNFL